MVDHVVETSDGGFTLTGLTEESRNRFSVGGGEAFDPDTTYGEWSSRVNLDLDISSGWHPLAFDAGLDYINWQPDGWESGLDGTQDEEDYTGLDLTNAVFSFPDGIYFFRYDIQLADAGPLHSDASITELLDYASDYSPGVGVMAVGPLAGATHLLNKSAKHNPENWADFAFATLVAPLSRVFLQVNAGANDGGLTVQQWNFQAWKLA